MNLTNPKTDQYPLEQSTSFSKYFSIQDRQEDYNYSDSNINQTLLLEATHLEHKNDASQQKISLLKDLREEEGLLSREKSLVFELCGDSESSQEAEGGFRQEKSRDQIEDLYNICRTLVSTLSKLQNKVEKIEEKESKIKDNSKSDWNNSFQEKQAQSFLTYSSLKNSKGSKGSKCQSRLNQKQILSGIFEFLQSRSDTQALKKENEQLKKKIIRLEISNEQITRSAKKTETENARLKQLLRQYQNFNKKLVGQKQMEKFQYLGKNQGQKMLSERQLYHCKSNICCFEEVRKEEQKIFPFEYYNFEEQKQNLNSHDRHSSRKMDQRPRTKVSHPTEPIKSIMNYQIREGKKHDLQSGELNEIHYESKITMDPISSRKTRQQHEKANKFLNFEHFRPSQSIRSSPYNLKGTTSKVSQDHHSRTFRELKEAKSQISRRDAY